MEINVDPDQMEERVDDAFQRYQQFHSDAVEHVIMPYVVLQADITNEYIPIPPAMISVTNIIPLGNNSRGMGMFDLQYQLRMTDWDAFYSNGSIMNYDVMMQKLALLQFELDVKFSIDFNRHKQRLYVRWNWKGDVVPGDYIAIEGYSMLDPDTFPDVYNDMWLKAYTTALIKRQWGENLLKYQGVALLGNTTLNGADIYQKAQADIDRLDEELQDTFQNPIDFFIG